MLNNFCTAALAGAILAANTSAINLATQSQSLSQSFAEFKVQGGQPQECYNMMSLLEKPLPDYETIKAAGQPWTDPEFPRDTWSLYWPGEVSDLSSKSSITTWKRATDVYSGLKIWGLSGDVSARDVNQGELGDCWFLAAAAAMAEQPRRIKRVFLDQSNEPNPAGIYGVRLHTLGVPHTVIVDDYVPVKKGYSTSYLTSPGPDKALWMPLLERAFAKYHGNYGHINGGQTYMGIRTLTGAPWEISVHKEGDMQAVWDKLVKKDAEGAIITTQTGAGTDSNTNSAGYVLNHAFTLVGVHKLESTGQKMVVIRNPHGRDTLWGSKMSNTYANGPDTRWTEAEKAAMAYSTDDEDGLIFCTLQEYYNNFTDTFISEAFENMWHDEYLQTADTEDKVPGILSGCEGKCNRHVMKVTSDVDQTVWISSSTYDEREYGTNCDVKGYNILLTRFGGMKTNTYAPDTYHYQPWSYGSYQMKPLQFAAGESLTIDVEMDFTQGVVPDWSMVAWGNAGPVHVENTNGQKPTDKWPDIPFNKLETKFINELKAMVPTNQHGNCSYGVVNKFVNPDLSDVGGATDWQNQVNVIQANFKGDDCNWYDFSTEFTMRSIDYERIILGYGGLGTCTKVDGATPEEDMTTCDWTCKENEGCGIITKVGDYVRWSGKTLLKPKAK